MNSKEVRLWRLLERQKEVHLNFRKGVPNLPSSNAPPPPTKVEGGVGGGGGG